MNARRYASLIVLGWMALAPAPASAEDPSPPAPLPPRPPEAPKPPAPEESERLALQRRMADLLARIEKAKDAGREREVIDLAQELATVKARLDQDAGKTADNERQRRVELEALRAHLAQELGKREEGTDLDRKKASDQDAYRRAKTEALRMHRAKLQEALADAESRGAEKEAEALRAQAKVVEEQLQAMKVARRRMAQDGEPRPPKEGKGPIVIDDDDGALQRRPVVGYQDGTAKLLEWTGDTAQMQQRLGRLQQAIRLLMEAGLPERANAVEKDAERLKAAIAARASASSPEGDLLREIRSLREEVQQMRRELGELRAMLRRDK